MTTKCSLTRRLGNNCESSVFGKLIKKIEYCRSQFKKTRKFYQCTVKCLKMEKPFLVSSEPNIKKS